MTSKKHSSRTSDESTERSDAERRLQNLAVHIAEERFKPGQRDFEWRHVNLPVMKDKRGLFGRNIVYFEPKTDNYKAVLLDKELDIWIIELGHIVGRTRTTPVPFTYEVVALSQLHDEEFRKLYENAKELFAKLSGDWIIHKPNR